LSLTPSQLGEFVLHLAVNRSSTTRKRTLPLDFSEPERLQHDLSQVKKLAAALDAECQFSEDSGCNALAARVASGNDAMNDDDKMDIAVIIECLM
jgi:hypothetical protein